MTKFIACAGTTKKSQENLQRCQLQLCTVWTADTNALMMYVSTTAERRILTNTVKNNSQFRRSFCQRGQHTRELLCSVRIRMIHSRLAQTCSVLLLRPVWWQHVLCVKFTHFFQYCNVCFYAGRRQTVSRVFRYDTWQNYSTAVRNSWNGRLSRLLSKCLTAWCSLTCRGHLGTVVFNYWKAALGSALRHMSLKNCEF